MKIIIKQVFKEVGNGQKYIIKNDENWPNEYNRLLKIFIFRCLYTIEIDVNIAVKGLYLLNIDILYIIKIYSQLYIERSFNFHFFNYQY